MVEYGRDTARKALEALGDILDSGALGKTSRLNRLLRYLVTEELEGRGEEIKAYTIGADVFERGEDFDPNNDSIVRVEMNRLRRGLELYYAGPGASAPLRIEVPSGQYRPVFVETDAAPPKASRRLQLPIPRLVMATAAVLILLAGGYFAFDALRGGSRTDTASLRPHLIRIFIDARPDSGAHREATAPLSQIALRFRRMVTVQRPEAEDKGARIWPEDYRISVLPVTGGGPARYRFDTRHLQTNRLVSSETVALSDQDQNFSFDQPPTPLQKYLADLLQRTGIVESDYTNRGDLTPVMRCVKAMDRYFVNQTDDNHTTARSCAEDLIADGVDDSYLHVVLAVMNREEHTDRRNLREGSALARALKEANVAALKDPTSSEGYYAQMTIYAILGNESEFLRAGWKAVELNPFDAESLGGFGARLNYRMRNRDALRLLDRAERLKATTANWRSYAFFIANLALGASDKAVSRALTLTGSRNPLYIAALAIAHRRRGDADAAAAQLDALLKRNGGTFDGIRAMYKRRNYDERLIAMLVGELSTIRR
jgi:adenylate cyclase